MWSATTFQKKRQMVHFWATWDGFSFGPNGPFLSHLSVQFSVDLDFVQFSVDLDREFSVYPLEAPVKLKEAPIFPKILGKKLFLARRTQTRRPQLDLGYVFRARQKSGPPAPAGFFELIFFGGFLRGGSK